MNANDIFVAIGNIDDDIILRSEADPKWRAKRMWLYISSAACLLLAITVVISVFGFGKEENPYGPTSEKYTSLSQLLADLSKDEKHSSTDSLGGGSAYGEGVYRFGDMAVYKDRVYYVNQRDVYMRRLDSDEEAVLVAYGHPTYEIEETYGKGTVYKLFIWEDKLVASGTSGEAMFYSPMFRIYQIDSDGTLTLLNQYEQRGSDCGSYIYKGELYILTSDGVCACGYGSEKDPSEFYPMITVNGKAQKWNDKDISILGEPERINYLALTKVSLKTGKIKDKQAFYSTEAEARYGAGWLVMDTGHTFNTEDDIVYTGSFSIEAMEAELGEQIRIESFLRIDYKDGVYRIIGRYEKTAQTYKDEIFCATADIDNKIINAEIITNEAYSCQTYWQEDKAVVCYKPDDYGRSFATVFFDGTEITALTYANFENAYYCEMFGSLAVVMNESLTNINLIDVSQPELKLASKEYIPLDRNLKSWYSTQVINGLLYVEKEDIPLEGKKRGAGYPCVYKIDFDSEQILTCIYEELDFCNCSYLRTPEMFEYNGKCYLLSDCCGKTVYIPEQ